MPQTAVDKKQINRSVVRLIKDDITELDVDAFVFYADPSLALGSGVGTAITVRGGPSVQKELDELGPIETTEAVVSAAGKLKADFIIHAVGPRFREEDIENKLRSTMVNSLARAEEKGAKRIAFPAMGAGYYGIPAGVSARVMLEVLETHLSGETGLEEVIICVLDTPQFDAFLARLSG